MWENSLIKKLMKTVYLFEKIKSVLKRALNFCLLSFYRNYTYTPIILYGQQI